MHLGLPPFACPMNCGDRIGTRVECFGCRVGDTTVYLSCCDGADPRPVSQLIRAGDGCGGA